ncbi:galactosylgalactosylxylosylprotein 3-beta-glucuronosyltransferase P [Orussus abietinus]|uniref:galactosylgalactosylxylosylprotein 3-beta-glucuronosyltransferase P n=1 Tax=Orussus abietinus TaxID=222816 RepID=UPI000626C2E9|nr:galactosylgalactosylxylosylprotein 3-beta-glucuronosyltransferase P [Orussus abietinus]XP_012282243.1 galactosylgalactosylxylosylprotein 3-beta-glucuronosyltransferase P [Orussus abietinus]XP_012282244.1 galactosylgalactosylxylosylprotein 3-beta-glucuronosyltransferase P [Orussus abietinus]
MKPSMKMGVIALVGICVVFYQYHLSTGIRLDQVSAYGTGGSADGAEVGEDAGVEVVPPRITEETIRAAVYNVQLATGLSPEVGDMLVQSLLSQLGKEGTALSATPTKPACGPNVKDDDSVPMPDPIYVVTPTYRRPEQIPELTRMAQTLMLVRNVHWLVVEDATEPTRQVTELLRRTGLKFEHMIAPMPDKYKRKKGAKPRGVSNRNRGLQWIRANATKGVFYFADDDNTYDLDLFAEIRKTKKVSMFPVGLCTKFGLSSPIVKGGKFAGFYDGWIAGRKFPVDMAGFAVSVQFLLERPNATMPFRAGYEEDGFLKSLAPLEPKDIELLADDCTRVLAWHTQTKKNEPSAPLDLQQHGGTNLVVLKQQIV